MKSMIALVTLLVAQVSFAQEQACYTAVQNAAASEAATEFQTAVQDVKVARYEASDMNTKGNIDVSVSMYSRKKLHHMLVKVHANDCTIKSVKALDESSLDVLALQAMKYKLAIKDTQWMSEADYEWSIFYTPADAPRISASLPKASLRAALNIPANVEIEIYTAQQALEMISTDEDTDAKDRYNYNQLKEVMLKDFTELRAIKVGAPDSGSLEIYLFGRTSDGRLVGLKTITVET